MTGRKTVLQETEDLRAATREAHEAIKDMRGLIREWKTVREEAQEITSLLEFVSNRVFEERMEESVAEQMGSMLAATSKAVDYAEEKILQRFDRFAAALMGEGDESLEALVADQKRRLREQEEAEVAPPVNPLYLTTEVNIP